MNIAIITENINNYHSGGRWYPWFLAYAFAYKGHDVKVITNEKPNFLDEFETFHNFHKVKIIVSPNFCANKKGIRLVRDIELFIGSPIKGVDYAVTLAQIYKKKSVALCYEPNNWITEKAIVKNIRINSDAWNNYMKQAKKADLFVLNTELQIPFAREWIPGLGDKVVSLYNGINSVLADEVKLVKPEDREYAVAFVGRYEEYKGVNKVWELLGQITCDKPKLYFICGAMSKENEKELKSKCEECGIELHLKVRCSSKEKFEILARVKFLFMPTRFEGFGIPPAEAFYLKTPVVAYELEVFKEVYLDYPHYLRDDFADDKGTLAALLKDNDYLFRNIKEAKDYVASFASLENFSTNAENVILKPLFNVAAKPKGTAKAEPEKKQKDLKPKFVVDKKVSVIMPVYNVKDKFLKAAIESVLHQTHKDLELVLVDDATNDGNKQILKKYAEKDRVLLLTNSENKGIAKALTKGVNGSSGDYIAFMDNDDTLEPRALEMLAVLFHTEKAQIVYTNEKQIDENNKVLLETRKPDWSLDMLLRGQYINHLVGYDAEFLKGLMPIKEEYGGSWDYDLLLRAYERKPIVKHHTAMLYNWRQHPGQHGKKFFQYVVQDDALKALNDFLERSEMQEKVTIKPTQHPGYFQPVLNIVGDEPKVLLIIPFINEMIFGRNIHHLDMYTEYKNYEIACIYHASVKPLPTSVESFIKGRGMKLYIEEGKFNFSIFNNNVFDDIGKKYDYVVLINDDVYVGPRWLTELIACFNYIWDDVGVVGAKLLAVGSDPVLNFPENWLHGVAPIQHAGVKLIKDLRATHTYKNRDSNWLAANYVREHDAVTFGLVAIDTECYGSVNLDPKYDSDLNDMDFCIRAKKKGWRILYNPNCVGYHLESVTRREQGNAGKVENHHVFARQYKELLDKTRTNRQLVADEAEGL